MIFVGAKSSMEFVVGRYVAIFIGRGNVAREVKTLVIGDKVVRYVHRCKIWKCFK